jgi:hypothetical protein
MLKISKSSISDVLSHVLKGDSCYIFSVIPPSFPRNPNSVDLKTSLKYNIPPISKNVPQTLIDSKVSLCHSQEPKLNHVMIGVLYLFLY